MDAEHEDALNLSADDLSRMLDEGERVGRSVMAFGPETFRIDLNAVRDDNLAVSLIGHDRPQRVPVLGEIAYCVDEDGATYAATVESLPGDRRVYLRVDWTTRRSPGPRFTLWPFISVA